MKYLKEHVGDFGALVHLVNIMIPRFFARRGVLIFALPAIVAAGLGYFSVILRYLVLWSVKLPWVMFLVFLRGNLEKQKVTTSGGLTTYLESTLEPPYLVSKR